MDLINLILILLSLRISTGQEIVSTGEHGSNEFLWAVGVDNLSFNISFTGITSINYLNFAHKWQHISTGGTTLVSFTATLGSSTVVRCYYGDNFNNPPYASVNGIDYRIDCAIVDSILETRFSIVSSLNGFYNSSTVRVVIGNDIIDAKVLELKYCDKLAGNGLMKISESVNAEYGAAANYTCSNSSLVVNNTYDKNTNAYSRMCNYDAKWSGQEIAVDCWFAPVANISMEQNGLILSGILLSENVCSIYCTVLVSGNPVESNATYFKNGKKITNTFTVESGDNKNKVSCQMANSYVNEVDGSAGFSPVITLDVLFQPEPVNGDLSQQQYAHIGEEYTMMILFNANPWIYISNTDLYLDEKLLDTSNASISYSGTRHEYRYPIAHVTKTNFGTYILSTRSPSPVLAGRVSNFTIVLNSTAFSTTTIPQSTPLCIESGGLSTAAVAAISTCVGIVVAIIATSAVWWWLLKRVGKESMNNEKKEPAYEPTYVDGQTLESAYEVVNRETIRDNARVASQEQTNVNSAYEVIR